MDSGSTGEIYRPLNQQREEIRIIELAPGNTADPLVAMLSTVSMQANPAFEAISYVWGNDAETVPIELNSQRFQIRKNLAAMLRRIRLQDSTRRLWADAICINQNDIPERSSQVLLMRRIYSECSNVLVWLGEEDDSTAEAFAFINSWQNPERMSRETAGAWRELNDITRLSEFHHLNVHACYQRRDNSWTDHQTALLALRRLFQRPWWSRAWTVQELALAKRAKFLCGPLSIDWLPFVDFADAMQVHIAMFGCCGRRIEKYCPDCQDAVMVSIQEIERAKSAWEIQFQHMVFTLPLLHLFRYRTAGDARDHIYAFFGLAKNSRFFNVKPDYGASIRLVYVNYAMNEIRRSRSLETLAYVEKGCPNNHNLPSWVPDWSSKSSVENVSACRAHYDDYSAGGQSNMVIPTFYKNAILSQGGVRIGVVKILGEEYKKHTDSVNWSTLKRWKELTLSDGHEWSSQYRKGPESVESSFYRCILADTMGTSAVRSFKRIKNNTTDFEKWKLILSEKMDEAVSEETAKSNSKQQSTSAMRVFKTRQLQRLNEWADDKILLRATKNDTLFQSKLTLEDFFRRRKPSREADKRKQLDLEIATTIASASQDRRFFITDTAALGTGPSDLRVGDEIWVLRGGNWPFALREDRMELLDTRRVHMEVRTHVNVGECYVHGVMDGELMESRMKTEEQTVYIR